MEMKLFIIIAIFIATIYAVSGDESLPPNNLRAPWSELEALNFDEWKIIAFHGWATPLDGGSKVFSFETNTGERFDVMAANPAYWNETERKNRKQVFYVIRKNRFFRLEPSSDEEKKLVTMIKAARSKLTGTERSDPKLLDSLIKRIQTRKLMFKSNG